MQTSWTLLRSAKEAHKAAAAWLSSAFKFPKFGGFCVSNGALSTPFSAETNANMQQNAPNFNISAPEPDLVSNFQFSSLSENCPDLRGFHSVSRCTYTRTRGPAAQPRLRLVLKESCVFFGNSRVFVKCWKYSNSRELRVCLLESSALRGAASGLHACRRLARVFRGFGCAIFRAIWTWEFLRSLRLEEEVGRALWRRRLRLRRVGGVASLGAFFAVFFAI
ncbi:hypothetical protein ENH_00033650 [Eimeria necatrix]|uniref:Uncharacterized protein n=1 Tax=Eimeria necatrix TaxID=51315 RepID=U6MTD6_9EIME|nr:hypothetical protein ENH_00033650 [Eimeria necatrix]CDJ67281.1 hypothetical protein ENH_00033650 [Eimeria necatrix]